MKPSTLDHMHSQFSKTSRQRTTLSRPTKPPRKRTSGALLAIGIALCASSAIAQTSLWQTVDNADGYVNALATDSLGNVFAGGSVIDGSGVYHGMISRSGTHAPGGETWIDYVALAGEGQSVYALAAADLGIEHHVVSGGRDKAADTGGWIIRRSLDQGATWVTLDRAFNASSTTGPHALALSNAGSIYAVGSITVRVKGHLVNQWLLRKGTRAGNGSYTWTTLSTPFDGNARDAVCVGNDVFVVGYSNDGYWQVRKSSNGGATWTLVDNFRYQSQQRSSAWAIAADLSGNLYVVGRATGIVQNQVKEFGVVRMGTSAGTVWAEADVFNYGGSGYVWVAGVAVDGSGKVHVVGSAPFPESTVRQWFTREGTQTSPGFWSWSNTDPFKYGTGYWATGQEIAVDATGNVFTAGQANDIGGVREWIVRRKLAP